MFEWLKRNAPEEGDFQQVKRLFDQMMEDGRHCFDAASNALLGGTDAETIKRDLWSTDKRINRNERRIRRLVTISASSRGLASIPTALVFMSLVKDAERIGDYAKNLFDLSRRGKTPDGAAKADLLELKDRISRILVKARNIMDSEDGDSAMDLLSEMDRIQTHCDDKVDLILVSEGEACGPLVSAALAYRFFKRTVSHTLNIVSSLVLPLDQLDYYDEDKLGRDPAT